MLKDTFALLGSLNWERLIVIVLALAIGIGITLAYEAQTHHFAIERIDRTADVLTKLESLRKNVEENSGAEQSKVILDSLYAQILSISQQTESYLELRKSNLKFAIGFLPWLVMSLIYLTFEGGDGERSWIGFFGALVFGGIFGGIGAVLPDFWWPWGNLAIYPFGIWIILLVIFAKFGGRNPGRAT